MPGFRFDGQRGRRPPVIASLQPTSLPLGSSTQTSWPSEAGLLKSIVSLPAWRRQRRLLVGERAARVGREADRRATAAAAATAGRRPSGRLSWSAAVVVVVAAAAGRERERGEERAATRSTSFLIRESPFVRVGERVYLAPPQRPGKGRLAALEEGGDALAQVLGRHAVGDPVALELEVVGERVVEALRRSAASPSARSAAPSRPASRPSRARAPSARRRARPRRRCPSRAPRSAREQRVVEQQLERLAGPDHPRQEVGHAAVGRGADPPVGADERRAPRRRSGCRTSAPARSPRPRRRR